MNLANKALLMSIRPEYTDLILAGSKTIELRRRRPQAPPGTLVIMYASQPTCALVGAFTLVEIVSSAPASLWAEYGPQTGVTRQRFMNYFTDCEVAFGLRIGDVWPLDDEVSLESLRRSWNKFQPPQSYRYLHPKHTDSSVRVSFEGRCADFALT